MPGEVARLVLEIAGTNAGALASIGEVDAAMGKMGERADTSGGKLASFAGGILKLSEVAAGVGAVVAGVSLKMSADFDSAITRLQTQAHMSAQDVQEVRKGLLDMAGEVGVAPTELAEGFYHVASALTQLPPQLRNVNSELDIYRNAVELSKIGNANLEDSTQAMIGVMAAYSRQGMTAKNATAELNAIVGAGDMKMAQLTKAMATGILPAAATFGLSLKDVGAALATLTDNVTPADEAATRLRMTFSMLAAPTGEAQKAFAAIGLNATDLGEAMRKPDGLLQALTLLRDHLSHIDTSQLDGGVAKLKNLSSQQDSVTKSSMSLKNAQDGVAKAQMTLNEAQAKAAEIAKNYGANSDQYRTAEDRVAKASMGVDEAQRRVASASLTAKDAQDKLTESQKKNDAAIEASGGLAKAKGELEKLGFTSDQVNQMVGKLGPTATEQAVILARAFGGGRSSAAIMTLLTEFDSFKDKYGAIDEGAQKFGDDWKSTTDTLNFKMDQFKAHLDAMAISFGDRLQPMAKAALDVLNRIFDRATSGGDPFQAIIAGVAELAQRLGLSSGDAHAFVEAMSRIQANVIAALPAIRQAGGDLKNILADALRIIVPLAIGFAEVASAVLKPALEALRPILMAVDGVIRFLGDHANIVVPAVLILTGAFVGLKTAIFIVDTIQAVQRGLMLLREAIVAAATAEEFLAAVQIRGTAAMVLAATWSGIVRGATLAWQAAQWLLNIALDANPIGLIVIAIAALVVIIIYAYTHNERFRQIVNMVGETLKTWFLDTLPRVIDFLRHAAEAVVYWSERLAAFEASAAMFPVHVMEFFGRAKDAALGALASLVTSASAIMQRGAEAAIRFIGSLFDWLYHHNYIWQAIVDAAHTAWNGLRAGAQAAWNAISTTIVQSVRGAIQIVTGLFAAVIDDQRRRAVAIGQAVGGFFASAASAIGSFFTSVVNAERAFFTGVFNAVASGLRALADMVGSALGPPAGAVAHFIQGVGDSFGRLAQYVGDGLNAAVRQLQTWGDQISHWFGDLVTQARVWGQNLMQELINGIGDKFSDLGSAVHNAAQTIANGLGFHSPPPEGPAADSDTWMPNMMRMFAGGIRGSKDMIHSAVAEVIEPLTGPNLNIGLGGLSVPTALRLGSPGPAAASGTPTNVNLTVNNPYPEPASTSIYRELRKLSALGVMG